MGIDFGATPLGIIMDVCMQIYEALYGLYVYLNVPITTIIDSIDLGFISDLIQFILNLFGFNPTFIQLILYFIPLILVLKITRLFWEGSNPL